MLSFKREQDTVERKELIYQVLSWDAFDEEIEKDMNENNSLSKKRKFSNHEYKSKKRKKREELSINAVKTFRQENVEIIVRFK